jgi:hypothetical protein
MCVGVAETTAGTIRLSMLFKAPWGALAGKGLLGTVQRLQARRVARQNSTEDNVTVDVSSMQEARKVVEEAKDRIDDASSARSIRLVV